MVVLGRALGVALVLLVLHAGAAFAGPRADQGWKRSGIPDDSTLGQLLDDTVTRLDRGYTLPDETFLFVEPIGVRWIDGRPVTRASVQDVRVRRNQDYYLQKTGEKVPMFTPYGHVVMVDVWEVVDSGELELDARIRFVDSGHEVDIEGLLPEGGVLPLRLQRGTLGTFVPQVAVRGIGTEAVDGVLLAVLPMRWTVENALPFLYELDYPKDWLRSMRKWSRAVEGAIREGRSVPEAEVRLELLRGAAFDELSDDALFDAAERALDTQVAVDDSTADRLGLMRVLMQRGEVRKAWPLVGPLLEELPAHDTLRTELAQVAYRAGHSDEAWTILAPVLSGQPSIVALSLCHLLRDASVEGVHCPAQPDAPRPTAPAPARDPDMGDGTDEELERFEEEALASAPTQRTLLSGTIGHPLIERVRIDAWEKSGYDIELEFTVLPTEDVVDVVIWINPRGGSWRPVQTTPGGGVFRTFYETRQTHTGGIYWYLTVQTNDEKHDVGSAARPFTLDP